MALPDGLLTYAIAWERGTGVLSIKREGMTERRLHRSRGGEGNDLENRQILKKCRNPSSTSCPPWISARRAACLGQVLTGRLASTPSICRNRTVRNWTQSRIDIAGAVGGRIIAVPPDPA